MQYNVKFRVFSLRVWLLGNWTNEKCCLMVVWILTMKILLRVFDLAREEGG